MKENIKIVLLAWWLFVLDQLSKYIFYNQKYLASRTIFQPAFNTGVSRSVQIPQAITILIAFFALGAFVIAYQRKYFTWLVVAILLAGTLGNVVDRIILNGVRDFLYIGSRFPIFNLADVYLNIGVCIFIIPQFFAWKCKQKM